MRTRRRARLLLLLLLALGSAACRTQSAGTLLSGAPRPGRSAQPPAAAEHYDSAAPDTAAVSGPQADAAQRALARTASTYSLQLAPEPRLMQLAAWIADQVEADQRTPPQSATDLATRALGLIEPTPHFIVVSTNDASLLEDRLVGEIDRLFSQHVYTHYGAFTRNAGGNDLVVIALSFRFVELAAVPRAVLLGTPIVLEGTLRQGHVAPELAVTAPDGQVERTVLGNAQKLSGRVATPSAGVYRVELLAQGPRGITVVANFPVYVDTPIPAQIWITGTSDGPAAGDEAKTVLALLNEARAQAGLGKLTLDAPLSVVALAHAQDMQANHFIAHTSPTTGSAVDRVTRAGIRTPLVLENIGRGYGLQEVHDGLMSSPGHRSNVLHSQATHVGIGVIAEPDHEATAYLVTQVFTRVTPELDADDAAEELLDRVNAARRARSTPALDEHDAMSKIAQRGAARYFAASAPNEAEIMRQVHAELGRAAKAPRRVSALLTIVSSLDDVAKIEALLSRSTRSLGIGLAQGTRADTFPNAICVLLLLGE